MADGPEGVQSFQVSATMYGEQHSIPAVPPGRYTLRIIRTGQEPARVLKAIEVGTSDVSVEVALTAPVEISGKLTFKGDGPGSANTRVMFVEGGGETISANVAADGVFSVRNVYAGKYRVSVWDNRRLPVADLTSEGGAFQDGFLHVGAEPVKLSLAAIRTHTSELKGFVMAGNTPAPGAAVILAPKDWTTDPAAFRSFQTDSDGSFHFKSLTVGEYVLFAVDRFDLEYMKEEVARPYIAAGRPVRITAGVVNSETISVATVAK